MSIVNFSIPTTLAKRIEQIIKQKGFASKAEFFRFAAIHFMDISLEKTNRLSPEKECDQLCKELAKKLTILSKTKKIPSLKEQLKDV